MSKKILSLVVILLFTSFVYAQETITITTYYPSPYGSYADLTTNRMKIGTNYSGSGTAFVNDGLIVEGNVGIGNTSPDYRLDVGAKGGAQSITAGATGAYRNARAADSSPYTQSRIIVYGGPNVDMSNWGYLGYGGDAVMRVVYGRTTGSPNLAFGVSSAMDGTGTFTEKVRIDGNGNVGIGTPTPGATLEVNGNIKVSTGGAGRKVVCWKTDNTLGTCGPPITAGVCFSCN